MGLAELVSRTPVPVESAGSEVPEESALCDKGLPAYISVKLFTMPPTFGETDEIVNPVIGLFPTFSAEIAITAGPLLEGTVMSPETMTRGVAKPVPGAPT